MFWNGSSKKGNESPDTKIDPDIVKDEKSLESGRYTPRELPFLSPYLSHFIDYMQLWSSPMTVTGSMQLTSTEFNED